MKNKKMSFLILLSFLFVLNFAVEANSFDTRANGMGGAYTTVVSDSNAVHWNPAKLETLDSFSIYSGTGKLYNEYNLKNSFNFENLFENLFTSIKTNFDTDKDNNYFSLNIGKIGFGSINEKSEENEEKKYAQKRIYGFAYSISNDFRRDNIFNLGMNHNRIKLNAGEVEKEGNSLDLGVYWKMYNLHLGLNAKNIYIGSDLKNELDKKITIGSHLQLNKNSHLPYNTNRIIALDLEINQDNDNYLRFGTKKPIYNNLFTIRNGFYQNLNNSERIYTTGLGINLALFEFDFSVNNNKEASFSTKFTF